MAGHYPGFATQNMGIGYDETIRLASVQPDTWSGGADQFLHTEATAPALVEVHALSARTKYNNNDVTWKDELGYSMHYMSDMAMPFHTNMQWGYIKDLATEKVLGWTTQHRYYENIVDNTRVDYVVAMSPIPSSNAVSISSGVGGPTYAALVLALSSSSDADYLYNQYIANPSATSLSTPVKNVLKNDLNQGVRNNMGLYSYVSA